MKKLSTWVIEHYWFEASCPSHSTIQEVTDAKKIVHCYQGQYFYPFPHLSGNFTNYWQNLSDHLVSPFQPDEETNILVFDQFNFLFSMELKEHHFCGENEKKARVESLHSSIPHHKTKSTPIKVISLRRCITLPLAIFAAL